jgi:hypothetical protein
MWFRPLTNRLIIIKNQKTMTRKNLISQFRYAGYHQDAGKFVNLYANNRISYAAATQAFVEGYSAKKHGIKCTGDCCKN